MDVSINKDIEKRLSFSFKVSALLSEIVLCSDRCFQWESVQQNEHVRQPATMNDINSIKEFINCLTFNVSFIPRLRMALNYRDRHISFI